LIIIIQILLGLGLYYFGRSFLLTQFRKFTSKKLRQTLTKWTNTPFKSFLCGIGLVNLTQTTMATSLLIINMVKSNALEKNKTFSVLIGTSIGAGLIIYIVSLNIFPAITFIIGISGIFYSFSENNNTKKLMGIIFGLSIVLYGLNIIEIPSTELGNSEWVKYAFSYIKNQYFVGFLLGIVLGIIFQSTILIAILLIAIGKTGLYGLDDIAMTLYGANFGDALLTAFISFKTQGESRQLLGFQILYKLLATAIFLPLFYIELYMHVPLMIYLAKMLSQNIAFQTATIYLILNIIPGILLWLLRNQVSTILNKIWPKTLEDIYSKPQFLVGEIYKDPSVEFELIEKEQLRVLSSLSEYFDIVRNQDKSSKINELLAANIGIEKVIKADLLELSKYSQLTTEEYELLNLSLIKVYSIEQMCKTTADMTRLFLELREKNICSKFVETATEGVHALILSLVEVMQSGSQMDIDFFNRMLSRQQSSGISKLRKAYINEDAHLTESDKMKLLTATTSCELLIFLIKDMSEKYTQISEK
jgi:phosphate:Na+ symporter